MKDDTELEEAPPPDVSFDLHRIDWTECEIDPGGIEFKLTMWTRSEPTVPR